MPATRPTPRRRTNSTMPRRSTRGASRKHRPAPRGRSSKRTSSASLPKLPQIELTEGQRREGTGLLLVVLALLFTLAIAFSPGAGLTSLRNFLLRAVGLGWVAIVLIMLTSGVEMITGWGSSAQDTVKASRNQVAVFLGMLLLS